MTNITPIGSGGGEPPTVAASRPRRQRPPSLRLSESEEHDGYTTTDVVNGLHGVCLALDMAWDSYDIEQHDLATAARVLASILQSRVET
jgi:hypothetical protein